MSAAPWARLTSQLKRGTAANQTIASCDRHVIAGTVCLTQLVFDRSTRERQQLGDRPLEAPPSASIQKRPSERRPGGGERWNWIYRGPDSAGAAGEPPSSAAVTTAGDQR